MIVLLHIILMSFFSGKWILHINYVHHSFYGGFWFPEAQYEVSHRNEFLLNHAAKYPLSVFSAPSRCRETKLIMGKPLFSGWNVGLLIDDKEKGDTLYR